MAGEVSEESAVATPSSGSAEPLVGADGVVASSRWTGVVGLLGARCRSSEIAFEQGLEVGVLFLEGVSPCRLVLGVLVERLDELLTELLLLGVVGRLAEILRRAEASDCANGASVVGCRAALDTVFDIP